MEIEQKSIQNAISEIKRQYSHVSGDTLTTAISRALNRAASQGRTAANNEIRQTFNISASRINNELKTSNSNSRNLTAKITASGAPLSFNNFQAKQITSRGVIAFDRKGRASTRLTRKSRNNAAKGVSVTITKGQTKILPTAFIQVANGGITVFARGKYRGTSDGFDFGSDRLPIGKMSTLSIPMMFANKEVLPTVQRKVEGFLASRIDHEVNYLLSK